MNNLIKTCLLILTLVLLTGCNTTPEKEYITVYEYLDPTTVPVTDPELPAPLPVPDITVNVENIHTLHAVLINTLDNSDELTPDMKRDFKEMLAVTVLLQAEVDPLIRITLDQDNANKQAIYMEKVVNRLEAFKTIIEYYRNQEAVLVVK